MGFHLAHCNRMLDNGGNMPWSQQAMFLYCRSEQWMAPCAILSVHSILLESWDSPGVQHHVGLKHSKMRISCGYSSTPASMAEQDST